MALIYFQPNKENDNLEDLITYFAGKVDHLPEVKLDKLIYIAQLYHYSKYGELLTNIRFFSLSYGPHAPLIRSTLKRQLENKSIYLTESRTSPDPVYSNPCMIIKSHEHYDKKLSSLCLKTLRETIEDWGDKPYEHILDYTTRTVPYLSTSYRQAIDWTLIQPYRNFKYVLSIPKRVQIHRFVEEPEKAISQHQTDSEWRMLSINEVAEIYLALCGELPDKIPSQGHLGFNLQTVFDAFNKLRDKKDGGAEKYPTEIDKAAQLTYSLLNSMSFRNYSSRVALKTGMLFLKKSDYSFKGDVLEENWPQGNDYKTLREWFRKVSTKVDNR